MNKKKKHDKAKFLLALWKLENKREKKKQKRVILDALWTLNETKYPKLKQGGTS